MSISDTHIKFSNGIKGESKHEKHKDQVEVTSWHWSASNASSFGKNSGGGRGKGVASELVFTHRYDNASPVLAQKLLGGDHLDEAVLYVSKSVGKGQDDFIIITLTKVMVTSISPSGDASGDVFESVSLAFEEMKTEYKKQKPDGGLESGPQFTFNTAEQKIS